MTRGFSLAPANGKSPLAGLAFLAMAGLAAAIPATPAFAGHGVSDSTTGTANAFIVDRLMLAKFSDIDFGGVSLPAGDHGTLELRPNGTLATDGKVAHDTNASFSAVFSLSGAPNQTFGISLPGAMALTSGGSAQSVRTFLHDAGPMPVLGTGGRGRFNVGAVFSMGKTNATKTQVYIGAIYVIVSNN